MTPNELVGRAANDGAICRSRSLHRRLKPHSAAARDHNSIGGTLLDHSSNVLR